MNSERVKEWLRERGYAGEVVSFGDTSTATVDLAAAALGVEPGRIAKTLAVKAGTRPLLVVAMGTARLDNGKFKAQFGIKAKMMSPDECLELLGHAPGGLCPFALKTPVEVFLDKSLTIYDIVYPAAGASNNCLAIALDELATLTGASWIDVCKTRSDQDADGLRAAQ